MKMISNQSQSRLSQAKSLMFGLFNSHSSKRKKLMILAVVLYIISPVDIIPDFIPFVGYADDVILPIVMFLANKFLIEQDGRDDSQDNES